MKTQQQPQDGEKRAIWDQIRRLAYKLRGSRFGTRGRGCRPDRKAPVAEDINLHGNHLEEKKDRQGPDGGQGRGLTAGKGKRGAVTKNLPQRGGELGRKTAPCLVSFRKGKGGL